MANNLTIPDKTTGDSHLAAEYQAVKDFINEPQKTLGSITYSAIELDGSGVYTGAARKP